MPNTIVQQTDQAAWGFALQSARGTAGTTFSFAPHTTKVTKIVEKAAAPTGAAQGFGSALQSDYNNTYKVTTTREGILTLDKAMAHILRTMASKNPTSTTVGTTGKRYDYDVNLLTSTMPIVSQAILYQSRWDRSASPSPAFTTPTLKEICQDMVKTDLSYTYASGQTPTYSETYEGSQQGEGTGSETFDMDDNYHMINPSGTNSLSLTLPAWWPSIGNVCIQSLAVKWAFDKTEVGCVNTGAIQVSALPQRATIDFVVTWDATYAYQVQKHIWYLTNSPAANSAALAVGFKENEGTGFSYTAKSLSAIAGSSPTTYYAFTETFPTGQWIRANTKLDSKVVTGEFTFQTTQLDDVVRSVTNKQSSMAF